MSPTSRAAEFPTGARLIDVGGYRMEIRCEGQGSPSIVFENGAMPFMDIFADFTQAVAKEWRACSYDRAGTGKSEAGPASRDATTIADELDRLLTAAGERGPFVFASWSAGAQYTLMHALRHPQNVAGIVFIEPRTPAYDLKVPSPLDDARNAELIGKLPAPYRLEFEAWRENDRAIQTAGSLPDVPTIVLTAASPEAVASLSPPADDSELWVRTHADLAASVPRGRHVIVEDAEHRIWERNPRAVLDAIRWVIAGGAAH